MSPPVNVVIFAEGAASLRGVDLHAARDWLNDPDSFRAGVQQLIDLQANVADGVAGRHDFDGEVGRAFNPFIRHHVGHTLLRQVRYIYATDGVSTRRAAD